MIGRLTGRVVQEGDDFALVLDVAGVGYEVMAPFGTVGRAKKDERGHVTLHIHTHVREDALSLFGFASPSDRAAFRALLSVTSIGPKSAVSILSVLPADELAAAIEQKELKMLTAVSGVGKKTAERILLELGGKLVSSAGAAPTKASKAAPAQPTLFDGRAQVLFSALQNLGYKPPEAERAVKALGELSEQEEPSTQLRAALAAIAK